MWIVDGPKRDAIVPLAGSCLEAAAAGGACWAGQWAVGSACGHPLLARLLGGSRGGMKPTGARTYLTTSLIISLTDRSIDLLACALLKKKGKRKRARLLINSMLPSPSVSFVARAHLSPPLRVCTAACMHTHPSVVPPCSRHAHFWSQCHSLYPVPAFSFLCAIVLISCEPPPPNIDTSLSSPLRSRPPRRVKTHPPARHSSPPPKTHSLLIKERSPSRNLTQMQ